jgi:hypothetical protein
MKGNVMPALVDTLENATDEEISEASNKLAKRVTKKFIISVVISVAAHFASAAIVRVLENHQNTKELTE